MQRVQTNLEIAVCRRRCIGRSIGGCCGTGRQVNTAVSIDAVIIPTECVIIIELDVREDALVEMDHDGVKGHDDARLRSNRTVDDLSSGRVEHTHALAAINIAVSMPDIRRLTAGLNLKRGAEVLECIVRQGGQSGITSRIKS